MSATYEKTDQMDEMISELIEEKPYHADLHITGVTVQVLFYVNDEQLQHRGAPAYAYVKATSLKERALGQKDATIVVDNGSWQNMARQTRLALIDHELYHLSVKKDKDQHNEFDDLHRPKIKLRKHDIEVGWFRQIAIEHKEHSIECLQANNMVARYRQTVFLFARTEVKDESEIELPKPPPKETEKPSIVPSGLKRAIRAGEVTITAG